MQPSSRLYAYLIAFKPMRIEEIIELGIAIDMLSRNTWAEGKFSKQMTRMKGTQVEVLA